MELVVVAMRVLDSLKFYAHHIFKNPNINELTHSDVLFVCHDADRGDEKDGLPYSKIIDSIFEDLSHKKLKCIQFALPFSELVGENAWGRPFHANRWFSIVVILDKILSTLFGFWGRGRQTLESSLWYYLLSKSSPKVVFCIGATESICIAGKKLGIPIVEVLHGLGYDTVRWGFDKRKPISLPNFILSFDSVSSKTFSALESKSVAIREIPHPWFKRFASTSIISNNISSDWIKGVNFIPENKKVITVSLTWGYDGDHHPYDAYEGILKENGLLPLEVLNAIESTKDEVFWCIRRHPLQMRLSKYDYQKEFLDDLVRKNPNCEWEKSSQSTQLSLFLVSTGHMTMMSMSAYDAAMLGLRSLLLCPTLQNHGYNSSLFLDLEEKGYVEKVEWNVQYLIKWALESQKTNNLTLSSTIEQDWENFLKNDIVW